MWSITTDNQNNDFKIQEPESFYEEGRTNTISALKTQRMVRATSSARIFEQLKQTDRMMLSTVFINPIWNIGLASSKCPKWPGHSAMLAVQVSHFIFLSIVPSLGSLKPPGFGFPLSVVSPCSICTTDICRCINQIAIIQSTVKKIINYQEPFAVSSVSKNIIGKMIQRKKNTFSQRVAKPVLFTSFKSSISPFSSPFFPFILSNQTNY